MTTNTKYITFFVISIISLAAFIILSAKLWIDISKDKETNVKKEEFESNENLQEIEESTKLTNQPISQTKKKAEDEKSSADQDKTPLTPKQVENDMQQPIYTPLTPKKTLEKPDNLINASPDSSISADGKKEVNNESLQNKNILQTGNFYVLTNQNTQNEPVKKTKIRENIFQKLEKIPIIKIESSDKNENPNDQNPQHIKSAEDKKTFSNKILNPLKQTENSNEDKSNNSVELPNDSIVNESTKNTNKKFIINFLQPCNFPKNLQNYLFEKFEILNLNSDEKLQNYFENSSFCMFQGIIKFFIEQIKNAKIFSTERKYQFDLFKTLSKIAVYENNKSESEFGIIYDLTKKVIEVKYEKTMIIDLYKSFMLFLMKNIRLEHEKDVNSEVFSKFINQFNGGYKFVEKNENSLDQSRKTELEEHSISFSLKNRFYTLFPDYKDMFHQMIDDFNVEIKKECELKILNFPQLLILTIKDKNNFGNSNFLKEYSQIDLPGHFDKNQKLSDQKRTYKLINIFCKIKIQDQFMFFNFYRTVNNTKFNEKISKINKTKNAADDVINEIIKQTEGDILLIYDKI
ncbi:hypothetical protein GVAV_001661 [Gurleya vavrai]